MTDRPLIFSAPMVRALLDGRKTQTRRALTLGGRRPDYIGPRGCTADPACWGWDDGEGGYILADRDPDDRRAASWHDFAASWRAGDRAWVRERFAVSGIGWGKKPSEARGGKVHFYADPEHGWQDYWGSWRPSIHMPRWASRLTLIVTDVRVQRLQDILTEDCRAEGCSGGHGSIPGYGFSATPGEHFRALWNSLHGAEAWAANPWVCALTFTVQLGNIDQLEVAA